MVMVLAPAFTAVIRRYRIGPSPGEFHVPVALVYAHQGEDEALTEAAPLVARRVGALLDEWITSDDPR